MIDTPEIIQTVAQHAAIIHLTIPRAQIREQMGPGIGEVMAAAKAQGLGPAGPWFTHHLSMAPATFDFEISVPVTAPVTPTGRVVPGHWAAMRVARAVYRGPYEGLAAAWPELNAWIEANGLAARSDYYESYVAGPESSPDPAQWRTELSRPLVD